MKYFLHDTSAFDDEKVTELYLKYGYEGLGLFYTCLEKLAKQEKPVKTSVLKSQLKVGKRLEKCWSFMEQIGIISSSNGETFNEQLLNFSEKYQIKKEKTRKKVSEWREKQSDIKSVTSYVPVSNPRKVKLSKVKESKVNKYPDGFELIIEKWLKYKTERKDSYKQTGLETFIKQLLKFSDNDPVKATQIIERSMANNWKGIFELKPDKNNSNGKQRTDLKAIAEGYKQSLNS